MPAGFLEQADQQLGKVGISKVSQLEQEGFYRNRISIKKGAKATRNVFLSWNSQHFIAKGSACGSIDWSESIGRATKYTISWRTIQITCQSSTQDPCVQEMKANNPISFQPLSLPTA